MKAVRACADGAAVEHERGGKEERRKKEGGERREPKLVDSHQAWGLLSSRRTCHMSAFGFVDPITLDSCYS